MRNGTTSAPRIVICGAGLVGSSSAYYLSSLLARLGKTTKGSIVLVDESAPLSLTSSKSTECFRDCWTNRAMFHFMSHSIDLLQARIAESKNKHASNIQMFPRGYAYFSHLPDNLSHLLSDLPVPIREHTLNSPTLESYQSSREHEIQHHPEYQSGVDVIRGAKAIQKVFPMVTPRAEIALHARRCGWVNAQQLGSHLFNSARENGVKFQQGKLVGVKQQQSTLTAVEIQHSSGEISRLDCDVFINASGPFLNRTHRLLSEEDLPVRNELHAKVIFRDELRVVPRDVPLMIWSDEQTLDLTDGSSSGENNEDLLEILQNSNAVNPQQAAKLFGSQPSGVHLRPYGEEFLLLLWEYWHADVTVSEPPGFPLEFDELYAEVALRGISAMIPGMKQYLSGGSSAIGKAMVDGGYYCKTPNNLPILGEVDGVGGAFIAGAFSGYGVMGCNAAGDFLARMVANYLGNLPSLHDLPPFLHEFSFRSASNPCQPSSATRDQL